MQGAFALPAALLPEPRAFAKPRQALLALALPGLLQGGHSRRDLLRRASFVQERPRDGTISRHRSAFRQRKQVANDLGGKLIVASFLKEAGWIKSP
jgi:hypothetical protein